MRVDKLDLWVLLLSTIRYSMGRATYMPGLCRDMLNRYHGALTSAQLNQIAEEVRSELRLHERLGHKLGHDCDHKTWIAVAEDAERHAMEAL